MKLIKKYRGLIMMEISISTSEILAIVSKRIPNCTHYIANFDKAEVEFYFDNIHYRKDTIHNVLNYYRREMESQGYEVHLT